VVALDDLDGIELAWILLFSEFYPKHNNTGQYFIQKEGSSKVGRAAENFSMDPVLCRSAWGQNLNNSKKLFEIRSYPNFCKFSGDKGQSFKSFREYKWWKRGWVST
jgi:hypothetical protein